MKNIGGSCAVVGAGIAGIAVAIRLAAAGHKVTIFEKNENPGGKLSQFYVGDYRFDFGPSLFTMPEYIEELFRLCGKRMQDYFEYELVNPGHRYFYDDGTVFDAYHPASIFAEEAAKVFDEKEEVLVRYFKNAQEKYMLTKDMFLSKSLHEVKNYFSKPALQSIWNFNKLGTFRSLHNYNTNKLSNPKLIQYFNRFATYNGSDPYRTPSTLSLVAHLEIGKGVYYPKGGMYAITKALYTLALEMGVVFRFSEEVKEIIVAHTKVVGVKVASSIINFDKVVSNMDVYYTYHKLLPSLRRPNKILNQEKSYAAIVFYWGINKQFQNLKLHNIFWSDDYKKEFEYLVSKKLIYEDATVYVNITSKHTPTDAPDGCENWFVMVNAPHLAGQDWPRLVEETRGNCLKKLSRLLKTDITPLIVEEQVLTPLIMHDKTNSAFGALYGNSSNSRFASFLRHPNFTSRIKNLYFCGGTVHPGGGIPLCLLSAKIVADRITRNK